ncbi:hypothetical protein [Crassaminicella thermophila]|nr:hypothetical protein [Crassaminicella thermophila]
MAEKSGFGFFKDNDTLLFFFLLLIIIFCLPLFGDFFGTCEE